MRIRTLIPSLVYHLKKVYKRISIIIRRGSLIRFDYDKKKAIDFAFTHVQPTPRSFADLGGVWGVHAVYTFYTLDQYDIRSAFLLDTDFTPKAVQKSQNYQNLVLIQQNFGTEEARQRIDHVDVIFFFDVLLHQVKPDWDEILEMYAPIAPCFVIYNPQFIASDTTIRLLDLGCEEYFANVPHRKNNPLYQHLFQKMYDIHPQHDRIWRDIHNVWQWGITDWDLKAKMNNLGFELKYYKNCGHFGQLENFENHAFVFHRN